MTAIPDIPTTLDPYMYRLLLALKKQVEELNPTALGNVTSPVFVPPDIPPIVDPPPVTHDRLHEMTNINDHFATAWRIFHSTNTGTIAEIALGADGTHLISTGPTSAPVWATPAGVQGLGIWRYRTETGTPPSSGQIRFNNANISASTEFYLHETTDGGTDVAVFLQTLIQDGSILYIQDRSNSANRVLIEISSSTDNGTYRTYGIQSIIEEGTEPSQNQTVILIASSAGGSGGNIGGSDTQVQYNNSGAFAGDSGLVYDSSIGALTITAATGGTVAGTGLIVKNIDATLATDGWFLAQGEPGIFDGYLMIGNDHGDVNAAAIQIPPSGAPVFKLGINISNNKGFGSETSAALAYYMPYDETGQHEGKISFRGDGPGTGFNARFALESYNYGDVDLQLHRHVNFDIDSDYTIHADFQGDINLVGLVDGRDVDADGTKLNTIETNAKDDQTAGEIEAIVNHDNLIGFLTGEHFLQSAISITLSQVSDSGALAALNTVGTTQIDNNAVTLAKQADIATARILGRVTASTGDPEALTGTQATTLLDNFTSGLKGLAPSSGGGTTNFLRADGTWVAPPTGSAPVDSVFGRTGAVTALQADYDGFFLTPAEGNAAYAAINGSGSNDFAVRVLDLANIEIGDVTLEGQFGFDLNDSSAPASLGSFGGTDPIGLYVFEDGSNTARIWTDQHFTGTNVADWIADGTKLDGIASGATLNSTDAFLLARANHTGTQLHTTISDFDTGVAAAAAVVANTNKTTNATHTSHVIGATALTLVLAAITGQTDIGAAIVSTDELLINDVSAGIRRTDISRLTTFFNANLSLNTARITAGTFVAARIPTHTGNVTGQTNLTIANDAVTFARMQNIPTANVIGRVTGGTGNPEDLTTTQVTTLINTFTSSLKGSAPSSGGGTTNFLRADGTWASPGGFAGYTLTLQTGTSYTAVAGDFVVASNTGTVTITLPASVVDDTIIVKKSGATGTVTVDGNGSETIDGDLTFVINTQYDSITLIADGSNWFIT